MPHLQIRLEPMTREQCQAFLEADIPRYAAENVAAGFWPEEGALHRAQEAFDRFLPMGVDTPGHHLFVIREVEAGMDVGIAWIGSQPGGVDEAGFIYNLYIDEPYRRRGYARQAMLKIEQEAKHLGWTSLGLHVFGHNTPARELYASLGYEVRSMNMTKAIETQE
jgi:RimJ/RimL family protein N-acetyltransferase